MRTDCERGMVCYDQGNDLSLLQYCVMSRAGFVVFQWNRQGYR